MDLRGTLIPMQICAKRGRPVLQRAWSKPKDPRGPLEPRQIISDTGIPMVIENRSICKDSAREV